MLHVDREELKRGGAADGDANFGRALDCVVECIRENPGIAGADAVTERVRMQRKAVGAAVKQLVADGRVVARKAPQNGVRLYLPHAVPLEAK